MPAITPERRKLPQIPFWYSFLKADWSAFDNMLPGAIMTEDEADKKLRRLWRRKKNRTRI